MPGARARDFNPGRLDPNRTAYDYLIILDFATPDPVGCMPREVYKLQAPDRSRGLAYSAPNSHSNAVRISDLEY